MELDLSQLSQEQLLQLVQAILANGRDPMGPFSNEDPPPPPVAGDVVFGIRVPPGFIDVYGPLPFSSQYRGTPRQPGAGSAWQQAYGRVRQLAREFGGLVGRGDPNYPGDSELDRASKIYQGLGMGRIRLFYGSPGQRARHAVMAYFPDALVKQDILWAPENDLNDRFPPPLRPYRVEGHDGDPDTVRDDPGFDALDPANIDHVHAYFVNKRKKDGLGIKVDTHLIEDKPTSESLRS